MAGRSTVLAGLAIFAMGQTILFALLGPVAREIGLAEWQVGAIISAAAIVFVIVSPGWGRLSDRWGRRTVIVAGLAGYAVATLLFAGLLDAGRDGLLAASAIFPALLAARLFYAALAGGIQPASVALMADLTDAQGRSAGMAMVGAAFGLGSMLGPAVAAGLVGFGVLVPLFLAAGAALLIALLLAFVIPLPPGAARPADAAPALPIALRGIAPALALAFFAYVAISTLQQTTAFYIQDFTATSTAEAARLAGFAFMAIAAATLAVQMLVVQRLRPSPGMMLGAGLSIAAGGLILYLAAPTYPVIVAAFAVMGVGFGLVQPGISAFVSLSVGADVQGAAAGYVQAAMASGFVVGPLAGTAIYATAPAAALGLALASVLACLAIFAVLSRNAASSR